MSDIRITIEASGKKYGTVLSKDVDPEDLLKLVANTIRQFDDLK